MKKTWVQSLGQEDPLEKKMATHSSTLAWKIPWTEEPNRLQSMGLQRVLHDLSYFTKKPKYSIVHMYHIFFIYPTLNLLALNSLLTPIALKAKPKFLTKFP